VVKILANYLDIKIYIGLLYSHISINIIKHYNIARTMPMRSHNGKILELIKKNKVVTSSEVARFLKVSWNTADSYLKDLVIEDKIERIKKEGVTLWLKR
tara:strand:- start:38 stop:334 length:297 start_codon:yes stop_codon:yes gene_type:complete